jgi:tRNA threonylcarbamoyl adenosine modification protein YjeE
MTEAMTRKFSLEGEGQTRGLAASIGGQVKDGDLICLNGALGSGKTTFARGLIQALQRINGEPEEVISPTFTLVQNYETEALTIFHFDLYRVEHEMELLELGFEDALQEGLVLVEWPDKLGRQLPIDRLDIALEGVDSRRLATLTGHGRWASRLGFLKFEGVERDMRND